MNCFYSVLGCRCQETNTEESSPANPKSLFSEIPRLLSSVAKFPGLAVFNRHSCCRSQKTRSNEKDRESMKRSQAFLLATLKGIFS